MIVIKSYNHLWEQLVSNDNIKQAIYDASHGNMRRKKLDKIKTNPDKYLDTIREWISNYEPIKHTPKIINDGISQKKREIIVPTVSEHIVQHAVMLVLKPIFLKGMYEHSYASIPNRGCHLGMKTVKKWTQSNSRYVKYCMKLDIRKYFDSISQDILIAKLRRIIHDERFLDLLIKIIRTTDKGLPLGFYTSQWFANFYLQEFDHYVKESLHVKHYIRYMDDIVMFCSNKRELHKIHNAVEIFLNNELELSIKDNWQIFRFHAKWNKGRFLDFMGFRFYRNRVTLRRKIALKAMRKARHIAKKKKATVIDARQMLTYKGWTLVTDTYDWFHKYISCYVNFRKLRKIVSNYDKKRRLSYVV